MTIIKEDEIITIQNLLLLAYWIKPRSWSQFLDILEETDIYLYEFALSRKYAPRLKSFVIGQNRKRRKNG